MVNVIEVQGLVDVLKDVTGIKGDTGATPDITITATADALSSDNPSVTVTKTGTAEEPSFALAFSGLKGAAGADGTNGGRYGGTTAAGTVVDDLITFTATDVSNADNLRAGDVVVQIYNNESYLYVVDNISGVYVHCDYSTRVKLAESSSGGLTTTTKVNFNNTTKRVDITSAGLTNLALEKTYIPYACFNIEYTDSDSGSTVFRDAYMPIPAYLNKISNAVFVNFAHGQANWVNYLKNVGAIPSDATNVDVSGTVWVSYTA